MKIGQISQLLGTKVNSQTKKEAIEVTVHLLSRMINLFKTQGFGLFTFYGVNPSNLRINQHKLLECERYLDAKGYNYIKISVQWNIKFKEVMNFKEIGYFIFNPTFEDMIEITRRYDQDLFTYSNSGKTNIYYSNGTRIELEPDKADFGELANRSLILNFVDFKLFIDSILDFDLKFVDIKEVNLEDKLLLFAKNKFTSNNSQLEIIDVYDIRQNGIISFERSRNSPAIYPKVFHFDEIIWVLKLSRSVANSNKKVYRHAG